MRKPEDRQERIHGRIWDLIPWYVNGSLPGEERRAVEEHLAFCPRCREEERFCRRTAEALQQAGEVAPSPHPVQLARVMARIDESEKERGRGRLRRLLGGLRLSFPASPVRAMLAAQLAIATLLVGLVVWQHRQPPAPAVYRTLSDAEAPVAGAVRLRVLFTEDATEREIRELLLGVHGEIVGGPSPIGAYTLLVPLGGDPEGALLAHLRSQPKVRFAEPVTEGGAP
jgi:anti-sigma factor RsiW